VADFVTLIKGHDDEPTRRSVQNTLKSLYDKQYIGRLRFFDDLSDNPTLIYTYYLNDSGADMVEDPHAAFSAESKIISRHEIEITQFHIHLKRWAEKEGLILHWHQPKIDHKKTINPDAYFGLEDPKKPAGHNTLHYFLEIERAKVGNYRNGEPSIIRKLGKYYDFYDTEDCEREWGFRKFRVITVVRNADKQTNLCQRLSERYSHRMFWVTAETMFRHNIGGEVFKTPKDFSKSGYSFLSR
jgi:hypothetical protein